MSQSPCFIIEESRTTARAALWRTTDGSVAAAIFRTREAASQFAAGFAAKTGLDGWIVRELSLPDAISWLKGVRDADGVTTVVLDPRPQDSTHREAPVEIVLAMLEGASQQ